MWVEISRPIYPTNQLEMEEVSFLVDFWSKSFHKLSVAPHTYLQIIWQRNFPEKNRKALSLLEKKRQKTKFALGASKRDLLAAYQLCRAEHSAD